MGTLILLRILNIDIPMVILGVKDGFLFQMTPKMISAKSLENGDTMITMVIATVSFGIIKKEMI